MKLTLSDQAIKRIAGYYDSFKSINQLAQEDDDTSANESRRGIELENKVKITWRTIVYNTDRNPTMEEMEEMVELTGLPEHYIKNFCEAQGYPLKEQPRIAKVIAQEQSYNIGDETPIGLIHNITQRNGQDVYIVGGNESGFGAMLLNEQDLKQEISRYLKNQEYQTNLQNKKDEESRLEQERNDLKGFTDNMNPRQKGTVEKFLLSSAIVKYNGNEFRQKEFVEYLLENNYNPSENTIEGKPAAINPNGNYVLLQKTAYEYLKFLSNL